MIADRMLVTTCPDCATTFKLTVALLEKAGGQVRCGRCATVFDANLSLREQEEAPTVRIEPADRSPDEGGEFAIETGTGSRWIFRDRPPEDDRPPASDSDEAADPAEVAEEVPAEADAEAAVEDATADASADAAADVSADASADAAAATADPFAGAFVAESGTSVTDFDAPITANIEEVEPEPGPTPDAPEWLPPLTAARPQRTGLWAAGGVALLLLLAGQIVHATRHDLAALPGVGRALVATYAGLGIELAPAVDLAQYDTVDLTAVAEPVTAEHGWLIIETRVQNKGPKVQPFPHIFVGLLDRWQETIAGRYFRPDEYVVTPVSDYSRMGVGSTVDAQFIIVDPGPSATGFVLEFCAPVADSFVCETE